MNEVESYKKAELHVQAEIEFWAWKLVKDEMTDDDSIEEALNKIVEYADTFEQTDDEEILFAKFEDALMKALTRRQQL